jgi:hypothetical protein
MLVSGHHPHAIPGVMIAAGVGIRPPDTPPTIDALAADDLPLVGSVLDVTPTLLALLGIPVGEDMAGRVRSEWIDPDWLARHPVSTVPTHDTEEWRKGRLRLRMRADDLEERLAQLRALGYVDAPEHGNAE